MEESAGQVSLPQFVQKLRAQNEKLRGELEQLRDQLKQALKAQKRTEIEHHRPNFTDNSDAEVSELQSRLQALGKEATSLRLQLAAKNDETVAKLINDLAYHKNTLKGLESNYEGLQKVAKEQKKALGTVFNEEEAKGKLDVLRKELSDLSEREKTIKTTLAAGQTERKAAHAQMIDLETQCRDLYRRAKGLPAPEINEEEKKHEEELAKWEKTKNTLEKAMKTDDKAMRQKEAALETALREAEDEERRRSDAFAKAEEDIKLKELKVKELKSRERQLQQRNAELRALEEHRKEDELQSAMKSKQTVSQLQEAVHQVLDPVPPTTD